MDALKKQEFNLIVVGNSNVGKTTMIESFENKKSTKPKTTANYRFIFKVDSNTNVCFNVWEVNCDKCEILKGTQIFDAAIFMYDITNSLSFKSLEYWILNLKPIGSEKLTMIMVGNKSDCSGRQVENDEAYKFAKKFNMLLLEISAKTGSNIDILFKNISYKLLIKNSEKFSSGEDKELNQDGSCNYIMIRIATIPIIGTLIVSATQRVMPKNFLKNDNQKECSD